VRGRSVTERERPDLPPASLVQLHALPAPLRTFLWIVIGLWALSLAYSELLWLTRHSWYGFDQIYLGSPAFDFYDYLPRMDYLHDPEFFTAGGYPWYYPAPGALVYAGFYAIVNLWDNWVAGYLSYIALAVGGILYAALRLARAMERRGVGRATAVRFVLLAAVFSWPFYFALERGNIEAVTWFLLAAGVWALARERWILAAVLLGAAASVKLYPGLMFAVFLRPRRWKEIGAGVLTFAAITLLALRFLEPDILLAWHGVIAGVQAWTQDYAGTVNLRYVPFDHSAFALLKVVTPGQQTFSPAFMGRYMAVAGAVMLALFFGRVIRLPRLNQVLFVTVASVLLPPTSFDYTLVNLYVPFAWLVLIILMESRRGIDMRPYTLMMVLFGLLLGPETFATWGDFGGAALVKSVCLILLLLAAVLLPVGEDGEPGALAVA